MTFLPTIASLQNQLNTVFPGVTYLGDAGLLGITVPAGATHSAAVVADTLAAAIKAETTAGQTVRLTGKGSNSGAGWSAATAANSTGAAVEYEYTGGGTAIIALNIADALASVLETTGATTDTPDAFGSAGCIPTAGAGYDYATDGPLPYLGDDITGGAYNEDYKAEPGYPDSPEDGPKPAPTDLASSSQLRKFTLNNTQGVAVPLQITGQGVNILAGVNNYSSLELFPTAISGYLKLLSYEITGTVEWDGNTSTATYNNSPTVDPQQYFDLPSGTTEITLRSYGRGARGIYLFIFGSQRVAYNADTDTFEELAEDPTAGITRVYSFTVDNSNGSAAVYPQIEITGVGLSEGFIKLLPAGTVDQFMLSIPNAITGTLTIDGPLRRVVLGGTDVTQLMTGTWLSVPPGGTRTIKMTVKSSTMIRGAVRVTYAGGVFL